MNKTLTKNLLIAALLSTTGAFSFAQMPAVLAAAPGTTATAAGDAAK